MQEPWKIGKRLAAARKHAGKTLRELSELTAACDPDQKGVLPAQISRIEHGALCDVRELHLLAKALNIPTKALLSTETPWSLVRGEAWKTRLTESLVRGAIIGRHDGAYKAMIESGVYRFLLLNGAGSQEKGDGSSQMTASLMKKYLLCVGRCDAENMVLDRHVSGEEIITVLEGEIEFWVQQPTVSSSIRRVALHPGDCLQYSSDLRHGFRATGSTEFARALFVFTQPLIAPTEEIVLRPASS